jgi:hypothetical protein
MRHIHKKGPPVTATEHTAKTPYPQTGLFATFRVFLHAAGSGVPSADHDGSSFHSVAQHLSPDNRSLIRPSKWVKGGLGSCFSMLVLMVVAMLALGATPAAAKQAWVFSGSFGAAGSTPTNPYPLGPSVQANFTSVATDTSAGPSAHDVYVADAPNHRVEKFDSEGNFILMFGQKVNKTKVEESAPAALQNVCTLASGDQCQAGTSAATPGSFESSTHLYLAVDSSSGASAGDVYVADSSYTGMGGAVNVNDDRVSKFDEAGHLLTSWASGGQLDGSSVPNGPFNELTGVAVDFAGNLWVYGTRHEPEGGGRLVPFGRMYEFKQDASFLTDWKGEFFPEPGLAVDSEDDLYVTAFGDFVEKYGPDGTGIARIAEFNSEGHVAFRPEGLAIDLSTNDLYVDGSHSEFGTETKEAIYRFDASCHPSFGGFPGCTAVESFGSNRLSEAGAIAIDLSGASGRIYAVETGGRFLAFSRKTVPDATTLKPSAATQTSATLTGSVNPDGLSLDEGSEGCRFEWGETTAYGQSVPCDQTAAQIGAGSSPVEVSAAISGLQAGKTYHYRLVAANSNNANAITDEPSLGADISFGPPTITSTSTSDVTASSATLQADIRPEDLASSYHFEYLTEVQYLANGGTFAGAAQAPLQPVPIGSGSETVALSEHLQGLQPDTTYRYRAIAENQLGLTNGEALTFTTQTSATNILPDNRAWELVSPPDKRGAALEPIGIPGVVQATPGGGAITYQANAPTEANPPGNASNSQVLSTRASGGWGSRDITPPQESATGQPVGNGEEYRFFSSDLSLGVVQRLGTFMPSLSAQASEQTPYLRTDFFNANSGEPCSNECYRPLVSACPAEGEECAPEVAAHANLAPGTVFGKEGGPVFIGATPDLNHVVLKSIPPLLGGSVKGGLYEWSGGRLSSVSLLPQSEGGAAVSGELGEVSGTNARGAISADGSRVVWTSNGKPQLYLYDATKKESVRLDAGLSGTPEFQLASADTTKVLFTENGDLYEYDVPEEALHRLTEGAGVLGSLLGASEDGSYVYFAADGALAPGALSGHCADTTALDATCNLYVLHEGKVALVAVVSTEDYPDWAPVLVGHPSRVSPNGRFLAFASDRALSGYDNRDAVSGKRDEEVFLFDAQRPTGAGNPACASCNPSGARPLGQENQTLSLHTLVNGDLKWKGQQWLAATIPGWTPYRNNDALYQSRYLSNSGRLFFNSHEALSPQDVNGTWDVYEYEPPSIGGCTSASASFAERSGGCVALISSGTSPEESGFLDASEDGSDVFFLTAAKLSTQDKDTLLDVYDAHECSAQSPCIPQPAVPSPPCSTEASCRAAPTPQPGIFGAPPSATFSGIGNVASPAAAPVVKSKAKPLTRAQKLAKALKACRGMGSGKKPAIRRRLCEKRARGLYGPVGKTKKSSRRGN